MLTRSLGFAAFLAALPYATPVVAQEAALAATPRMPTVTVATVRPSEVVGQIPVSGTLVPRNEVLVYPQVSGFDIQSIYVDVGDTVKQGDLLIELNSSTLAAQLAQTDASLNSAQAAVRQAQSQIASAQAALTQAESALERSQSLRASGNLSQASLDQSVASALTARAAFASATDGLAVAQAQVEQATAQREIAALNLNHAKITAQVAGLVSERQAQIGAIASSGGNPMLKLIANGEIEVEAEVIETSLVQIKAGDQVELAIAGLGEVNGTVRLIEPTVDPVNRLGLIRITTPASPALRAGMFASGNVITDRHTALTVPTTGVQTDSTGTYVMVVKDGVISRREVTVGLLWQDSREVLSGVVEGDSVIAKAGAFFRDGDMVIAVPAGDVK